MNNLETYTIPPTSNVHVGAKSNGGATEIVLASNLSEIKEARVLTNIKIMDVIEGGVSQIDEIVITPCKLYFIETKHVKCKVKGNESDNKWELLRPNGAIIEIVNPVKQNNRHIQAFNSFFEMVEQEPLLIDNIVCIGDNHRNSAITDSSNVLGVTEICELIEHDLKTMDYIYDVDNIEKLIRVLAI